MRAKTQRNVMSMLLLTLALSFGLAQRSPAQDAPQTPTPTPPPAAEVADAPPADAALAVELQSPRAAMFTFLRAMHETDSLDAETRAAAWEVVEQTFAPAPDVDTRTAAQQLLAVLNKLGQVAPEQLPDQSVVDLSDAPRFQYFPQEEHDWVWEQLAAFDRWPDGQIVLARTGENTWQFSATTIAQIDALYQSMSPLPPQYVAQEIAEPTPSAIVGLLTPTFNDTPYWGWLVLLGCIFGGLVAGKVVQLGLRAGAARTAARGWTIRGAVLGDGAGPAYLALLALGLSVGLGFIRMAEPIAEFSSRVILLFYIVAIGWLLYNMVDVIDVWLKSWAEKTESSLDDQVVPLVRKSVRVFLIVVLALFTAENVFDANVTAWLAGLGIVGLGISLAAQDSIKNLFGSITVFFDRPFSVGDFISFAGHVGTVEEIGFRSTRIRLLSGALVTVPNMKFIDNDVENISARPSIRRSMDVTITYDTPLEKVEQAIQIVRDVLSDPEVVAEGKFDMEENPPQVAFDNFNADSLNIKAFYWYQLAGDPDRGWFTFFHHQQLIHMKLLRAFEAAGIEFAFPTQTLYLAGDPQRRLAVHLENQRLLLPDSQHSGGANNGD